MDDGVRAMAHEDALDSFGIAHVELQRLAIRRRRAKLRGQHFEAALGREAAELGAEVAGASGDEELHEFVTKRGARST